MSWFKKVEPKKECCIYCNKTIGNDEIINELKYEATDENGLLQEYVFGKICTRCSDVLDDSDTFSEMNDGEESN